MAVDIEKRVIAITETVDAPESQVSPEAIQIAVQSLHLVAQKYGPNSNNPRAYHNVPHGLDVMRRGIRLANLLHPYISDEHQTGLYDLIVVGASCHDVEQGLGTRLNERVSARYAVNQSRKFGNAYMQTRSFTKRLHDGVMVTEVDRKTDGRIVQKNLQIGRPDPYKFIMAFADINGIAMEGYTRMMKDATNLCYEIYGDPSIDQLYSFLTNQSTFLRQRLNNHQIEGDIEYYFPNATKEVYAIMHKAFHRNIISSYSLALALAENPGSKNVIGAVARRLDQSTLGSALSSAAISGMRKL